MERLWNSSVCAYSSHLIIFLSLSLAFIFGYLLSNVGRNLIARLELKCGIRIKNWMMILSKLVEGEKGKGGI
jgi:hypothetical protein